MLSIKELDVMLEKQNSNTKTLSSLIETAKKVTGEQDQVQKFLLTFLIKLKEEEKQHLTSDLMNQVTSTVKTVSSSSRTLLTALKQLELLLMDIPQDTTWILEKQLSLSKDLDMIKETMEELK